MYNRVLFLLFIPAQINYSFMLSRGQFATEYPVYNKFLWDFGSSQQILRGIA